MHLAQIWAKFQDEVVMLSVLSNSLLNLESFVQVSTVHLELSNHFCDNENVLYN